MHMPGAETVQQAQQGNTASGASGICGQGLIYSTRHNLAIAGDSSTPCTAADY